MSPAPGSRTAPSLPRQTPPMGGDARREVATKSDCHKQTKGSKASPIKEERNVPISARTRPNRFLPLIGRKWVTLWTSAYYYFNSHFHFLQT